MAFSIDTAACAPSAASRRASVCVNGPRRLFSASMTPTLLPFLVVKGTISMLCVRKPVRRSTSGLKRASVWALAMFIGRLRRKHSPESPESTAMRIAPPTTPLATRE